MSLLHSPLFSLPLPFQSKQAITECFQFSFCLIECVIKQLMLLLKFLTLLTTFQYRQKSIQGSQALSLLLLCMILFLFNEIFNFPLKTKSFNIIYYIIKVELQIHHCIKLLHRTNNLLIINCYFILLKKKKKKKPYGFITSSLIKMITIFL